MGDATILDLYRGEVAEPRDEHYLHFFPGGRTVWSTRAFFERTVSLAGALRELGIRRGERVMLLCGTRPEWHMADVAILALGAVNTPIYDTLTPSQVAFQARDSGAVAAIAENVEQMERFLDARGTCPELRHLIQLEGARAPGVLSLEELMTSGAGGEGVFWDLASRAEPGDLATIVYTSGTTGEPKGVMLSHENIVTNAREALERIDTGSFELGLEFLPLCHMIERIAGYLYMSLGAPRAYCSVHHVGELIREIRPSVFASVPRVLEKVQAAIEARAAGAPSLRRALFAWALEVGWRAAEARLAGTSPGLLLVLQHRVADRLVLGKIRQALGGRLNITFCGGAATPLHVHRFFQALGIPIQEAWGLTETSPIITFNGFRPEDMRLGSVGRPLPSYDLRLAPDGELLARGPSVFSGYWNRPGETAEAFDEEGFFRTGDIGTIDGDGFVFITDRKKDLIITAGGKNIAPQPIEGALKASPLVENAVLVGDGRPYVVALIAVDPAGVNAWASGHGRDPGDPSIPADPEFTAELERVVEAVNASLARYERIKRFAVLPEPLSVEGGELTPTLKVRRRVIEERYADLIESLYPG